MEGSYFSWGVQKVALLRFGNGPNLLVAFHGFSDSANMFKPLAPALSDCFTVYAFSLPYHGHTQWKGAFHPEDLVAMINHACQQEGKEQFSLMGYSMGGKMVLKLVPQLASRLQQLFLLAPDGIKTHPLYDVAKLPHWFIGLVKLLMKSPKLFFKIVDFAFRAGILSRFLYDFTHNHFSTHEQRSRFFQVSTSIKSFSPNLSTVKETLNSRAIPSFLVLGKRDEVIPVKVAEAFKKDLRFCQVHLMDKGHLLVDEDLAALLRQIMANISLCTTII